jgi:hypothetical protein
MLSHVINDFQSKVRESRRNLCLLLHLRGQPTLLLLERARKEEQSGLPVRRLGAERGLCLAQGEIVARLTVLNDALKRAIGDILARALIIIVFIPSLEGRYIGWTKQI